MDCRQYTVRGISPYLDLELRGYAKQESKSLNQVLLEMLGAGLGVSKMEPKNPELMELAGSWVETGDSEKVFSDMRTIDEDLWK